MKKCQFCNEKFSKDYEAGDHLYDCEDFRHWDKIKGFPGEPEELIAASKEAERLGLYLDYSDAGFSLWLANINCEIWEEDEGGVKMCANTLSIENIKFWMHGYKVSRSQAYNDIIGHILYKRAEVEQDGIYPNDWRYNMTKPGTDYSVNKKEIF